ncbi:recombinase family protein [Nonomuraea sp. NPDC047529]|uniref:recombinase family protein n=1 Tax=Nonomuraea sp. NPDC047529 TaxID=3155623 RepID=UPI0033D6E517
MIEDRATLIPAIGYVRVSMMLEEKISPAIQRDAIEALAARRGYCIPPGAWPDGGWIEDLDVSGRNFQRTIMAAISQVEKGTAKAILVWKYSRFGRNRMGNQLNLARLETAGGDLVSATEEVDATTAVGKFTRGMLMELAAFESDRAGEQWAEAFQNRLARGLPPFGGEYFGYVRRGRQPHPLDPNRTLRDPSDGEERYEPDVQSGAALVFAGCYVSYVADQNFAALATRLNRHGFTTEGGLPWSAETIRQVMDRGFAAGLLQIHDPECRCAKASRCQRRVFRPGVHAPLISDELWKRYLALRAAKVTRPSHSMHQFTGFISCWHCGGGMHLNRHQKGFICGSRARHDEVVCGSRFALLAVVEEALLQLLAEWAPEIEAAAESFAIEPEPPRPEANLEWLKKELVRVNEDLDRQTMQFAKGLLPEDSYIRVRDELLAERDRLISALESQPADEARMDPREAVPVMRGLIEEWPTLAVLDRRALLMQIVAKLEIEKPPYAPAWLWVHPLFEAKPKRVSLQSRLRLDEVKDGILAAMQARGEASMAASELLRVVPTSHPTLGRAIGQLLADGLVTREGRTSSTRYRLAKRPGILLGARAEAERVRDAILRMLAEREGEPIGAREMRIAVGSSVGTVGRALAALQGDGLIVRGGKGKRTCYQLAQQRC